jgi:DNA-binding NarL/FixJ family response regulator
MTASPLQVMIQDRSRLFREGIGMLIGTGASLTVVDTAATPPELDESKLRTSCDVILLEAVGAPWDVRALVDGLSASRPNLRLVGTAPPRLARQAGALGIPIVVRTAQVDEFIAACTSRDRSSVPAGRSRRPAAMPGGLTGPELQVLALITSGFTSVQMSQRLKTSAKTLENRRRSLFRKLGVQSQSQAVVVAVASGILGPAPASPPPL